MHHNQLAIIDNYKLSFNETAEIAGNFTKQHDKNLWRFSNLLYSKKLRRYFFFIYSYLRWVDDFIDDPKNSVPEKINFISHQREVLLKTLSKKNVKFTAPEENYLFYYIDHLMKTNELDFIRYVDNTFKSFEMDIKRLEGDGMFSESMLSEYLRILNEAIFRTSFLFIPMKKSSKEQKGFIGIFIWYTLMILEFKKDVEAGFINISRENVKKYNLDADNLLEDNKRSIWLRNFYPKIVQILEEELLVMNKMPFFVKIVSMIVWMLSYNNLIEEFNRVKFYDFKFGMKLKKEFPKEVKTFISTIHMSIHIFAKVFF